MTRITARYNGHCAVCGAFIRAGETIEYDRAQGGARHPDCAPFTPPADAIWISCGEGYGGTAFHVGQVVRNPHHDHPLETVILNGMPREAQERQRQQEAPVYLYVLHASQQYYREDGLSFGVGDEAGYVYGAYCRPATPEEAAPVQAAEAAQRARAEARQALNMLTRRIQREGEYPAYAQPQPDARKVLNTRTIYGGGSRYLIAEGEVWYCQGNGGDGDDWSRNNLGSEIACRLADPDGSISAELARLAAVLDGREQEVQL